MPTQKKLHYVLLLVLIVSWPVFTRAQTVSSPNYQVENSEFNSGGGASSSTNYSTKDSIGGPAETTSSQSTNFWSIFGFQSRSYPGVPGQPTVGSDSCGLSNALRVVIATAGNSSDTEYLIAFSSDNFSTTLYVQSDGSLGSGLVWKTYTNWGGATGVVATGLAATTTYEVKVKARHEVNYESAYSIIGSSITCSATITTSLTGIAAGSIVAGNTLTTASTSTGVVYGSILSATQYTAAQTLTVTTGATNGYTAYIKNSGNFQNQTGAFIAPVSGTNLSPVAFPSTTTAAYGYHTTDASLCQTPTNRFSANNTYAAFSSTLAEFACATGPVSSGENTSLVYGVQILNTQPAGQYQDVLTILVMGNF